MGAIGTTPRWFQQAVIYELHLRGFCDGNGDGVGDLPGLIDRLDYLQDLGVTALWLLPFYPSPMRDGGYDIADYTAVHTDYGTLADFERLLAEAHRRGLKVITELVINHTSIDHPWFQAARRAPPGSPARESYVWSDHPDRYADARVIFKDFETGNWTWDPVARAYYWHRFYAHQPDLNFDNPAVHAAVLAALDFWLSRGVDGVRLDAIPYLYERDGTTCENLAETHAFLRALRAHVDARYDDRMLLAEANQWPVDAAAYFGAGDECHMNFHFPLMPRLFLALQQEDRFPIVDVMRQTPPLPPGTQWATFLRNHDELTLEMVTEEERDQMYRAYAADPTARLNLGIRRRLAPLLRSRRKLELANALLFSLPGSPVLYYGDELGMGDNIYLGDRDGVRTPMQWSSDRNAGFSRAHPHRLFAPVVVDPEFHYAAINVEAQQQNPSSHLWWMKRLIALWRQHPVLAVGGLSFVEHDNPHVLALVRDDGGERVLVVANLSRFAQHAELELGAYAGQVPVELFGGAPFPPIGARPYPLSFGPHSFMWFRLEAGAAPGRTPPPLTADGHWTAVGAASRALVDAVATYAGRQGWFRGDPERRAGGALCDQVPLGDALGLVVELRFGDREPQRYLVPVAYAVGAAAAEVEQRAPDAVIARLTVTGAAPTTGVLYDALATGEAAVTLAALLARGAAVAGARGRLITTPCDPAAAAELAAATPPRPVPGSGHATVVRLGDRAVLKAFRLLEPGVNAEVELGLHLTRGAPTGRPAAPVAPVLGTIDYVADDGVPAAVAVVHRYVAHQGTAGELVRGALAHALAQQLSLPAPLPPPDHATGEVPAAIEQAISGHLRTARALATRLAALHMALADADDLALRPEPFTPMHQQSIYQTARARLARVLDQLRRGDVGWPAETRALAAATVAAGPELEAALAQVQARPIRAVRIRCHGDLHLDQVLHAGDDFVVIDLEGEPARPLGARRYKRSPLRDVATLTRSLAEVAAGALEAAPLRPTDREALGPWVTAWAAWMAHAFEATYVEAAAAVVPPAPDDRRRLLQFFALELAVLDVDAALRRAPSQLAGALTRLRLPAG